MEHFTAEEPDRDHRTEDAGAREHDSLGPEPPDQRAREQGGYVHREHVGLYHGRSGREGVAVDDMHRQRCSGHHEHHHALADGRAEHRHDKRPPAHHLAQGPPLATSRLSSLRPVVPQHQQQPAGEQVAHRDAHEGAREGGAFHPRLSAHGEFRSEQCTGDGSQQDYRHRLRRMAPRDALRRRKPVLLGERGGEPDENGT